MQISEKGSDVLTVGCRIMHITFWTTNDCNLNCSYCYNRIGNNIKKEYMSDDVADKAIELLQGLECWNDDDKIGRAHV